MTSRHQRARIREAAAEGLHEEFRCIPHGSRGDILQAGRPAGCGIVDGAADREPSLSECRVERPECRRDSPAVQRDQILEEAAAQQQVPAVGVNSR